MKSININIDIDIDVIDFKIVYDIEQHPRSTSATVHHPPKPEVKIMISIYIDNRIFICIDFDIAIKKLRL